MRHTTIPLLSIYVTQEICCSFDYLVTGCLGLRQIYEVALFSRVPSWYFVRTRYWYIVYDVHLPHRKEIEHYG